MTKSKSVAAARTIGSAANGAGVDLADVDAFVRVVEAGSFTAAATIAGMPKSGLSRRVARLEQALGVRLLQRTTRSLSLTDIGASYHAQVSQALTHLREARECASEHNRGPQGLVRISAPVDMGGSPIAAVLAEFALAHPNVHLEVDISTRFVDLVTEGFDMAIRAGKLRDSSLVARKLGESHLALVASPAYLARKGTPRKLADLSRHDCILFRATRGEARWKLIGPQGEESVPVRGTLSANDFLFVRAAALHDAGIALVPLPGTLADIESGALVRVLNRYRGPAAPINLVFPTSQFVPQRVALLRDFLIQRLNIGVISG